MLRGVNDREKRKIINSTTRMQKVNVVYLQETKI